jgi:2-polyprenyl-3-methyl-5-hydroxy-6-metoxy-1,4-benzoquinol methylase
MNFSIRTDQTELLDHPDVPAADIQRNLFELAIINKNLGGHRITWTGFTQLARKVADIHVCEIGCGGGDNLKAIENKALGKYKVSLTGIDMNPDCIHVAKTTGWKGPISFIVSDYRNVQFRSRPDIIFCSLFCHHFKERELIEMLQWMQKNSVSGFFINDLHRHRLAYHSIRLLTKLFSRSYLVKNDAPLSVLRSFRKKELKMLLDKAGIHHYTIQWKWAFRWLVIVHA